MNVAGRATSGTVAEGVKSQKWLKLNPHPSLGFGVLRRSTGSIHGAVPPARGKELLHISTPTEPESNFEIGSWISECDAGRLILTSLGAMPPMVILQNIRDS